MPDKQLRVVSNVWYEERRGSFERQDDAVNSM